MMKHATNLGVSMMSYADFYSSQLEARAPV